MENLRTLLKLKLSVEEYESLFEKMGITKTRFTQILNRPETMKATDIEMLSFILKSCDVTNLILITKYNCGYNKITVAEAEVLTDAKAFPLLINL